MKLLICNLKAHKTYEEIITYKNFLQSINYQDINLIIAPSNIYLSLFKDSSFNLCTQDIPTNNDPNITSNITINQLKSLNVTYSLIGHFERIKYFKETLNDSIIKIKNALENNLKVIFCLGETLEDINKNLEYQILGNTLTKVLNSINSKYYSNIIIAYEPTFLIGNKNTLNINKIITTIKFLKKLINDYYSKEINLVYGGNITPDNIDNFLNLPELNGFIISSSILNPTNLDQILKKLTSKKN